jgi:hypothetical protein
VDVARWRRCQIVTLLLSYILSIEQCLVLKVRLNEGGMAEEIGPNLFQFGGKNRWYGGILGVDGCVYAPPYAATGVLRIDPRTDSVDVIGDFPEGVTSGMGGCFRRKQG